jgi:hypothetical protein
MIVLKSILSNFLPILKKYWRELTIIVLASIIFFYLIDAYKHPLDYVSLTPVGRNMLIKTDSVRTRLNTLYDENKTLEAYICELEDEIYNLEKDTVYYSITKYETPTNTIADTVLVDRILAKRKLIINSIADRFK